MESRETFAVESFSSSWLSNGSSSLNIHDEHCREPFENFYDSYSLKSMNCSVEIQNFDFNVNMSSSSRPIVDDADELLSKGFIKHVCAATSKQSTSSESSSVRPALSLSSRSVPAVGIKYHILRTWRQKSWQIKLKCFGFLKQLCIELDSGDMDNRACSVQSLRISPEGSDERNTACSSAAGCHMENLIYEAVLHCKKSMASDHHSQFF